MNPEKFTYISLMVGSVFFPLFLSFDKKVSFYKKWKYLLVATLFPLLFFVVWDAIFTANGVWRFNDAFVLGPRLLDLPLEEWLFFVIVPYSSVFIYEVLKLYLPHIDFNKIVYASFVLLVSIFALLTLVYRKYEYTFFNFLFNTLFLSFMLLNKWFKKHLTHFTIAFLIALLPMFIVNGVLTAMPVVEYHPYEYSGIRIYTIPFEDFFYFLLLFGMNIMLYEWLQLKKLIREIISN